MKLALFTFANGSFYLIDQINESCVGWCDKDCTAADILKGKV